MACTRTFSPPRQSFVIPAAIEGAESGLGSIGTLVAAGEAPEWLARDLLTWAALQMPDYIAGQPWLKKDLEKKVDAAFKAGLRQPRVVKRRA